MRKKNYAGQIPNYKEHWKVSQWIVMQSTATWTSIQTTKEYKDPEKV